MDILILLFERPATLCPDLQNFIEVLALLGCFAADENDKT